MKKKKGQEGKVSLFLGMDASGREVGTRKGGIKVDVVGVFCIHI
jgi:hypothetical protein